MEILESRRLLTNLVALSVSGNSISLTDATRGHSSSGDDFSVSYTSSQVVLTGVNGTSFKVGDQTVSTYTASITGPASISMHLNARANAVTITGDGTASLSSLNVNLGTGRQSNSLVLTKVIVDSIRVDGGRNDDHVTLNQCTVNSNLYAKLGNSSGDVLDLESTTVKGSVSDWVGQLIVNQSTVTGNLSDRESGKNSTLTTTGSTFSGAVSINMGKNSVINLFGAATGPNHFQSSVSITGARHRDITINQHLNSVVYDVTPSYKHAGAIVSTPTITSPTVKSQSTTATTAMTTPTITGTYDSARASVLTVNVNGKTYKLGTDSQLTTPSAGNWSLNLTGVPLTSPSTTVSVGSADSQGNIVTATGTIASEQAIIDKFLTANHLTATKTSTGLNYVITTNGTGAIPTNGKTVTVNYTGHILNADGTQGTEFDSNVDAQFNHVQPFHFVLGAGNVIAGWDQAFALLPVGTVAKLLIPSALAYGTTGSGSSIPANSILIFDVTVVSAV